MKKLVLLAVATLLSAQTLTVGHIACKKEQWHKDTLVFGKNGDRSSFVSYIKMGRCFVIKEPIAVRVVGESRESVQFFYLGNHYWTSPEAIN